MKKILSILAAVSACCYPVAVSAAGTADTAAASGGIDTSAATIWIAMTGGLAFCAIIAAVVVLAKKNKGN